MNTTAKTRREILNENMSHLIREGKDCFSCVGHCCTYEHNSMRVTPLETFDVLEYLEQNSRLNQSLINELQECIKQYRLDKEFVVRGNQELRRYYTCPFYKKEKLGCSISKHHKPYGCLAFNPLDKGVSQSGHCHSYIETLSERENLFKDFEEKKNLELKEKYQIYWDKKDLPSALLYLINKVYPSGFSVR